MNDKKMAYPPGLVLHGSTWRIQKRIPKECLPHYGGKQILYFQTDKASKQEAAQVAWQWLALQQSEFERLKNPNAPLKTSISFAEMQAIIAKMVHSRIASDGAMRSSGRYRDSLVRGSLHQRLVASENAVKDAISFGDYSALQPFAATWLKGHGFELQEGTPESRAFLELFAEGLAQVNSAVRSRDAGISIQEPSAPTNDSVSTLLDLIPKLVAERKPKPRTIEEWQLVVRIFHEVNTKLTLSAIKKHHVVAFKDHRIGQGIAASTINKQLGMLLNFFHYAIVNDLITINPASNIKVLGNKVTEDRQPYSVQDLKTIFSSPIYTSGLRPRSGAGEASYWLPLLATFTGARLEELGQLLSSDIRQQGSVWYINISNAEEGTSVKTDSSKRKVPIHPKLVSLGFIEYAHSHSGRIFPLLKRQGSRTLTANFSKWWGRYARGKLLITDSRKVFHSFRHSFKDACRNGDIHKEIHDALTGHASSDVGSSYGLGHSLETLSNALNRLNYDSLDLSHLEQSKVSTDTPSTKKAQTL